MNKETIIDILSKVPKQILIKCAEIIFEKNKKKETLTKQEILNKIKNPLPTPTPTPKPPRTMSESKNVMLAHPYDPDKHSKKVEGWWISIKYDGVRAKWNGEEMESRTGLIYTLPEFLTEQLRKVTDEDGNPMELDGELWAGNDTFALMSGLARRYENNDDLWAEVTYMVFDTPDSSIPFFEDRVKKVLAALKRAAPLPNIKLVKHTKFDPSKKNIDDELKKVEDDGGEGLVLRKPKSPYVFKRSQDMLKVKSWSYKEAVVIGYTEGTGRLSGLVGSLMVKSDEFGDEDSDERKWVNFKVGSGLNDWQRYSGGVEGNWKSKEVQSRIDEARQKMKKNFDTNNENYQAIVDIIKTASGKERSDALHLLNSKFTQMACINSVITFRFKELTKDGNPSFPTFVGVRDYE